MGRNNNSNRKRTLSKQNVEKDSIRNKDTMAFKKIRGKVENSLKDRVCSIKICVKIPSDERAINPSSIGNTAKHESTKNSLEDDDLDLEALSKNVPDAKYSPSQKVYAYDEEKVLRLANIRRVMYGPTKELLDDELKVKERNDTWHYFVHFYNWSSRFDMWVIEKDIYPDNEQSRELSSFILKSVRGIKKASKLAKAIIIAEEEFWAGRKPNNEKKAQSKREKEEIKKEKKEKIENVKKEIKNEKRLKELHERNLCDPIAEDLSQIIQLSASLKKIMVDEWEAITQLNLFPTLPAMVTVEAVLNRYLDIKLFLVTEKSEQEEWSMAMQHLSSYFDSSLPYLLYPQETLLTLGPPKSIYSCQYLLRLFTKLPTIINLQENSFIFKMCDLQRYLTKNQLDIFQQSYRK